MQSEEHHYAADLRCEYVCEYLPEIEPQVAMLTEIAIKSLKPKTKVYRVSEVMGLCLEVHPNAPRCSCTMRTARSRTSGENLVDLFMAPFSQA